MQNPNAALMERYPDIGFLLSVSSYSAYELFQGNQGKWNARRKEGRKTITLHSLESIGAEVEKWQKQLPLEGMLIHYVYGIGLGYYYEPIKEWLHADKKRLLIFLEEDLAAIAACMSLESGSALLHDPQVIIKYLPNPEALSEDLEELVHAYPTEHITCTALEAYAQGRGERFEKIYLELMRKAACVTAYIAEALNYHKLCVNLFPNFQRLPGAFYANRMKDMFRGVPAIICGAGPSLAASIPILKKLEQKALILAGGSSITALSSQGVFPHLAMAIDPNQEEYHRLKPSSAFETPLLYGNRMLPDVFLTCNGARGYLRSETGGECESWFEDRVGLEKGAIGPGFSPEAFSVTTLVISFAYALGCNPIIFAGIDLAYTDMQKYAPGVMDKNSIELDKMQREIKAIDQPLKRKDRKGKDVYTLVRWVMESDAIGSYAQEHSDRVFLNATEGGIGFPGIPYRSLEEIAKEECTQSYDLRGKVHALTQQLQNAQITPDDVRSAFQELKESLLRCEKICLEMLEEISRIKAKIDDPEQILETGKMLIKKIDLEEELAFDCLLSSLGPALDRLIFQQYQQPLDPLSEEYRRQQLAKEEAKWGHFHTAILELHSILPCNC